MSDTTLNPTNIQPPQPLLQRAAYGLAVAIALWHLWANLIGTPSTLLQNALHFGGFVVLCALITPPGRSAFTHARIVRGLDIAFAALVASCAIYMVWRQDAIFERGVTFDVSEWAASLILIVGAMVYTLRTTGWIIPVLIAAALSYICVWGALVPGVFRFAGLSLETVLFRSVYGDDALFGTIATISSTFVYLFILFGAFLLKSGAGDFIVDLAKAVAGRFIGGPGFVAVGASALTGTISGSAVANTASTGVITIPMMKRAGFPPHFAGGVEAAASSGGQLMPPIMGAGAFVMAAATQIPYATIVAAAVLPAVLYFATVLFFVRIQALRSLAQAPGDTNGEKPADPDPEPEPVSVVLRRGGLQFFAPVIALMVTLILGYTPTFAASIAIATAIGVSYLTPRPMSPRDILDALDLGTRNMVMTGILLCAVGLIVNAVATAGIGNTFSLMIAEWSNGSLFAAIVLVGLASLILGLGLPVTAAYIVLATLSAPALYQLILQGQLIDQIAAGAVAVEARAIVALIDAELAAQFAEPMPYAAAAALAANLPPDVLVLMIERGFSPAVLAAALLSAHMIIFWLSQDSNVTPPVCLAAFTAAAIAEAKPMQTGFAAWKIAKGLYLVPLLFAYTPLLSAPWPQALAIAGFAFVGLWALSAALEGHGEAPIALVPRLCLAVAGLALLIPSTLLVQGVAAFTVAAIFVWHRPKRTSASAGTPQRT